MVQFHRSGEASGYQKMSGFCFLSHNSPIQAAAGAISINGLPTWPALSTRQNDAFCLVNSQNFIIRQKAGYPSISLFCILRSSFGTCLVATIVALFAAIMVEHRS